MDLDFIKSDDKILLVWGSTTPPTNLEEIVTSLRVKVGDKGCVQVENESMLQISAHAKSTFDVALSGIAGVPYPHSDVILGEFQKIVKPNGYFVVRESHGDRTAEKLQSALTMAGFTNIVETPAAVEGATSSQMQCQKPNFEVGKSSKLKLNFAKKVNKPDVSKVWTLGDTNDDVEIIDSDALLGADDFKRPDLSGVKTDCGTSKGGKKRACKGCTCGLKEELNGEPAPLQKSACGSCYLGDAFRCASCPYLGMPPFKAGDQVTLSDRQLKPDV